MQKSQNTFFADKVRFGENNRKSSLFQVKMKAPLAMRPHKRQFRYFHERPSVDANCHGCEYFGKKSPRQSTIEVDGRANAN